LQSYKNATREVNHKEDHDTEELTNTGAYESLQKDNIEMHNYETPTNAAYETVNDSMKDDHQYSMLQN
jgi:hypothetical protein